MVKIRFWLHDKAGRTVAIQFFGSDWLLVKWDELPRNIQWMLAEMSAGEAKIDTGVIPWLKDWQNGK